MYAMNPQMAKKLIENFKTIDTTVDIYTHQHIAVKYHNFTLFPPLAYELSWSEGTMESLVRPRNKRIEYLQTKDDEKSKKELKKYSEHIDRAVTKKLLGIGHPHTGSDYVSSLLKAYGIDAGEEEMGRDGIISWMFTVYDLDNPYYKNKYAKSRYFSSFEHIIMFARDPLNAIPGIMYENSISETSMEFQAKHILANEKVDIQLLLNPLEQTIERYYRWTKIAIEKNKPELIVRVECDGNRLLKFLDEKGINISMVPEDIKVEPYKGDAIDSQPDWLALDDEWKIKINKLCSMLNYEAAFDGSLKNMRI